MKKICDTTEDITYSTDRLDVRTEVLKDSNEELMNKIGDSTDKIDSKTDVLKVNLESVSENTEVLMARVKCMERALKEQLVSVTSVMESSNRNIINRTEHVANNINEEKGNTNNDNTSNTSNRILEGFVQSSIIEIENSTFQAYGKEIQNQEQAYNFVGDILLDHMEGKQHCYSAFVLKENPIDNDEGRGSISIKSVLKRHKVNNVVVVVVRKFGGKHI